MTQGKKVSYLVPVINEGPLECILNSAHAHPIQNNISKKDFTNKMPVNALNCQRATEQKPEIKFDFRIKV